MTPDTKPAEPPGCEWCPEHDRPAWTADEHTRTTPATVILGRDPNWFLCEACAALPHFRRFTTRRPMAARAAGEGG